MERVAFYFDPLCPWCWITSHWARDVQQQRSLDIEWKFFSLAVTNDLDEDRFNPLRIAALARREGGNDAAGKAYVALGELIHGQGKKVTSPDWVEEAGQALSKVGLDPSLAKRALDDPSTKEEVVAEHTEAVEKYGTFGVPWLVIGDADFGFFGPVLGEMLQGQEALALWDNVEWTFRQPYLYELKRGRNSPPSLRTDGSTA